MQRPDLQSFPLDAPAELDESRRMLREAEAALRESRRQFASMLETLSGVFYSSELKAPWRFTFVSKSVKELTGRRAEYFEQQAAWAGIIHPDDMEMIEAEVDAAIAAHRCFSLTYRIIHVDGGVRWVHERGQAVYSETGEPLFLEGIIADMTRQKALDDSLQLALRAQQSLAARLRATLDIIPQIVWTADADGTEFFNRRWLEFTGFKSIPERAERLQLLHPDDRDVTRHLWLQSLATGKGFEIEYRLRHHNGDYRWLLSKGEPEFDDHGNLLCWYGTCTDIHDSKLAKQALDESERRFRDILDSMPQMVWSMSGDREFPDYYNRRWYEFTGLPPTSTGGDEGWRELFHPDDAQAAFEAWSRCRDNGELYEREYRVRHHSGEYRWVVSRGQAERDLQGKVRRWYGTWTDIHDQVLARQALARSELRAQRILDSVPQVIWCADALGRIDYMSARWTECFETPPNSSEDGWRQAIHPDDWKRTLLAWSRSVRTGEPFEIEVRILHERGGFAWTLLRATAERDEEGQIIRWFGTCTDIHRQVTAEEQARWAANHDALTKLPNRLLLQERVDEQIRRASEDGGGFALLLLDLDHFKRLNDTVGHDAGDMLLETFSARLRAAVGVADTVARLGGDEFAVILADADSEEKLDAALSSVMASLREPCVIGGRMVDCHASIGATLFPRDGGSRTELMKNADVALYAAKRGGRCNFKLFRSDMRSEFQERSAMLGLARAALNNDWIRPHYQPQVDLDTGRITGFEALLRWEHPEQGLHHPDSIRAAFEDLGLASEISDRMVEHVIRDMRSWLDRGVDFGFVSINAAAAEFRRGDFAERLLERLAAASVPTHCLHVEVTETVFLGRGAEFVERALKLLSANGVRIALDDFGTGYASLSHLKQFPVDFIKIDQSFVRDLLDDPDDAAIVDAVIKLGKSLGIGIVAEGIEILAQHAMLSEMGCGVGQGFYYGKAAPAERVPLLLKPQDIAQRAA